MTTFDRLGYRKLNTPTDQTIQTVAVVGHLTVLSSSAWSAAEAISQSEVTQVLQNQ